MGIRIGSATRNAVVAYADDITLFVTAPEDMPALSTIIRSYESATGACLNIGKSKVMAEGAWDTAINKMDIPYCPDVTILEFRFTSAVSHSGNTSWKRVTG
jgi:hypothetical protein